MAHLDVEAGNAPIDDMDSAAAAIGDLNLGDDDNIRRVEARGQDAGDGDDAEANEDQSDDGDDNDLDVSEDEDDESDESQGTIEAPVSLTAEEKAKFAALPKEAQQYVAELEGRRASQVQTATTKAAEAQRTAEAAAARADAVAQARFAEQIKVVAQAYAPQAPDPALAYSDPGAYIAQKAQYDHAKAQHDDLMQQATSLGTDADTAMSEAEVAQRDRELLSIPEVQNEATREQFFSKAIEAGKQLGLDMNQIGHATASELKALRQVSDWQEKAAKYDAALARNMQRVRDGKKARTTRPNAAQPSSGEKTGYREARQRLAASGDVKDAALAIGRLG